jgi:hypothetical protein
MCCPPKTPCECCCTAVGSIILTVFAIGIVAALLYAAAYFLLLLCMLICYFFQKCDTCYYIYMERGCIYLINDCIGCCKIMCCRRNNRISDESSYDSDSSCDSDIENQIELPIKETKTQDIIIIQNPGPVPFSMGRECNNKN